MKPFLARLRRDVSGVAMAEFAMVTPILFILAIGLIEAGRMILLTQKLQSGSFILADLAARDKTLSEEQLDNIFLALNNIIEPFQFDDAGTAIVTSIAGDSTGDPIIRWQRQGAGTLTEASRIGVTGGVATLPDEISLADDETLIIAEVFFAYEPFIAIASSETVMRRVAYFKPRLGSLHTLAP